MKAIILLLCTLSFALVACHQHPDHKTVVCIPVYGQSLALGEEAIRITDFDSLAAYRGGRIVTERLDHDFGYFDNNDVKRVAKRLLHYRRRAFELTVYSMAEGIANHTGSDTLICIFPGGQGATDIAHLGKGSEPYREFIESIQEAYHRAQEHGWRFVMPALCWMQGESDVTDYPASNFKETLLQFHKDINQDVKQITGQQQDMVMICYQTNPVSRGERFDPLSYRCREAETPQTLMELVRDQPSFHASSPTYPYDFVREAIHIDAVGHQLHGMYVALAALDILHQQKKQRGLLPLKAERHDKEIIVNFNIPYPPLVIDTTHVAKADNYGFSVITQDHRNIAKEVFLKDNRIHILCAEQPDSCRVRYAINGEKGKSGRLHGPRGNLRDSQGDTLACVIQGRSYPLHNWCWQFDLTAE